MLVGGRLGLPLRFVVITRERGAVGLKVLLASFLDTARDLAPIVIVVGFFQLVVLQQPLPNIVELMVGLALVLAGLVYYLVATRSGPGSDPG